MTSTTQTRNTDLSPPPIAQLTSRRLAGIVLMAWPSGQLPVALRARRLGLDDVRAELGRRRAAEMAVTR